MLPKSKTTAQPSIQIKKLKAKLTKLERVEAECERARTACERTKSAFQELHAFNTALLKAMPFAIDIVDTKGKILYMNDKLESLVGKKALGKKCWSAYKDNKKQCLHCPLRKPISVGKTETIETQGAFGGKTFHITHSGMEFKGKQAVLEIFQDITQRKQLEETLRQLSVVDELTKLYNRRGFFTLAEHQMKVSARRNIPMVLLFIDLDNMKWINDTMGHPEGDRALTDFSRILRNTCRESDIAARMGGDEFAVLAVGIDTKHVSILVRRLRKSLQDFNGAEFRSYPLLISLGHASYNPKRPRALGDMFERADKLMYQHKQTKARKKAQK